MCVFEALIHSTVIKGYFVATINVNCVQCVYYKAPITIGRLGITGRIGAILPMIPNRCKMSQSSCDYAAIVVRQSAWAAYSSKRVTLCMARRNTCK